MGEQQVAEKSKKALIIVDVQNDFCPGGTLAVSDGDNVVVPLSEMIDLAVEQKWAITASRDWHPEKTDHFIQWPPHCIKDTIGAQFHPRIYHTITFNARVFSKGTEPDQDAYSSFDGQDEHGRFLNEYLFEKGVDEVYIGGLATDYCVKATIMEALSLGFKKVYLLTDACRAVNVNPGDEENAIREMREAGAIITTTKEVIDANKTR